MSGRETSRQTQVLDTQLSPAYDMAYQAYLVPSAHVNGDSESMPVNKERS